MSDTVWVKKKNPGPDETGFMQLLAADYDPKLHGEPVDRNAAPEPEPEPESFALDDLAPGAAAALRGAGLGTARAIAAAGTEELTAVRGVGRSVAAKLRAAAAEALGEG